MENTKSAGYLSTLVKQNTKPWLMYTSGQTVLNFTTIALSTKGTWESVFEDTATNILFNGFVNGVYSPIVNGAIDLGRKYYGKLGGRVAANTVSVLTSLGFYGYGLLTNDNNPAIPALVAGGLGVTLTNFHVNMRNRQDNQTLEDNLK